MPASRDCRVFQAFKILFPNVIYMKGGSPTGFKHVEDAGYQPRLLISKKVGRQATGRSNLVEVPCHRESLNDGDAFILDTGKRLCGP